MTTECPAIARMERLEMMIASEDRESEHAVWLMAEYDDLLKETSRLIDAPSPEILSFDNTKAD